jgi:hypothetical protein
MTMESPVWVPRGSKFCDSLQRQPLVFCGPEDTATHLHVAADDDVVCGITDDLVLELLPSLETLLDQDLRAETETLGGEITELLLVLGKSRSESSEGEGGTEDDRVADFGGGGESVVHGRDGGRVGGGDSNLCKRYHVSGRERGGGREETDQLDKMGIFERPNGSSEDLNTETLEDTHLVELDSDVEGRLSSEREEDAVGTLLLEDVGDVFSRQGNDCSIH